MKMILHALFFFLGCCAGIWWGVHNPVAAKQVSQDEGREAIVIKQKVAEAKIELLQKFQGGQKIDVAPMIQDEQKNADDAKAALASSPPAQ